MDAQKTALDTKTKTAKEKAELAQKADKELANKTKAAEEANTKFEAAKAAAEKANKAEQEAIDAATKAKEAATKAETEYNTAKQAYDAADTEKQKTLKADLDAKEKAKKDTAAAKTAADKAQADAAKANVKAKDAENTAEGIKNKADQEKAAAVDAQKNAAEAKTKADKEKADVEKAVKELEDALNKRSKEVYDGLFGDKDDKLKEALGEADKNLDPKDVNKEAKTVLVNKMFDKDDPDANKYGKTLMSLFNNDIEANKQNIAKNEAERLRVDKMLMRDLVKEAAEREKADKEIKAAVNKNTGDIATNKTAIAKVDKEYKAADVALGKRIDQLTLDTTKGLAKVAALGSLHAVESSGNARFNFAVAAASYKSENAVAIGAFYHPNRNVVLSFGTALGDGDNVYSVGASFAFGKSGEPANVSTAELYDMIAALQQKVAELEARK